MASFYRTFSMLLHLCEIAEVLQIISKYWSLQQKSQGHKA